MNVTKEEVEKSNQEIAEEIKKYMSGYMQCVKLMKKVNLFKFVEDGTVNQSFLKKMRIIASGCDIFQKGCLRRRYGKGHL